MILERVADRRLVKSLRKMENLQQRLNELFVNQVADNNDFQFPPINLWISEHGAKIEAEVPGIESKDIDILVMAESLTLKGNRQQEESNSGSVYHRQERGFGSFARTIELPFKIEVDKVEAEFSKGILCISLPRAESDKPKKIAVKSLN